jgi:hypothetical protein
MKIDIVIATSLLAQLGGFLGVFFCLKALYYALSSHSWSISKGIIINSELDIADFDDGYSFKPTIRYKYRVDGKDYNSNRVYYGSNILTKYKERKSKKLLNKYLVGTIVDVYYNPNNIKQSVLEPGIRSELITALITSIGFIVIGLFFYLRPEILWNLNK